MKTAFRSFIVAFIILAPFAGHSSPTFESMMLEKTHWIWHPDLDPQVTNRFTYFRKEFELDARQAERGALLYFAADANARFTVNGHVLRRKVTRYHPERIAPENIDIGSYLQPGKNVILVLHHNWGTIKNFQRQPLRRAGLFVFSPTLTDIISNSSWRCAVAPEFTQHEQQIIGVIGDLRVRFPIIMDGGKIVDGLASPGYREAPPLEWKNAVEVDDGPWTVFHRIYAPEAQREYFFPVKRLLAAGSVVYPATVSASVESLRTDVDFPAYMEQAENRPDADSFERYKQFPMGESIEISGKPGETKYVTFDFHQPVHGYPLLECESGAPGIALSLGYGELGVSPYDGTNHVDPVTGKIRTQGVVGTHYGDRYLTAGTGTRESVEIPDERTARYLTVHVTFPDDAPSNAKVVLYKLGIVKSQYPIDWKGNFQCGDQEMDQIVALSKIHAEITMSDTYVDTPGREDGQWLEDIRLRARVAETWGGDYKLRELTLMHAEKCRVGGKFLSFAPQSFVELTGWDWGMQWIAMLYDHWQWTGSVDFYSSSMRKQPAAFSPAKKVPKTLSDYIDLLLKNLNDKGLFCSRNVFADIRVGSHPRTDRDASVIVHTWLIDRLRQAIEIAKVIQDKKCEDEWTAARNRMIGGFNKYMVVRESGKTPYAADVWYADGERLEGKSQAAQVSAILAGLFEPDERKAILDEFFPAPYGMAPEGIAPWNNPTYLYRALKALSDNGRGERALAHLKRRMSPYLPGSPNNITPLNLQGPLGGPLPEYFVTHQEMGLPVGEPCSGQPGDPTGSHGWAAVALLWLHDSMLGVSWETSAVGEAGAYVTVEPNTYGLPFVSGSVMTPKGAVSVFYDKSQNQLEFCVPDRVKVTLRMPADCFDTKMQTQAISRGFVPVGPGWILNGNQAQTRIIIKDSRTLILTGGGRYRLQRNIDL